MEWICFVIVGDCTGSSGDTDWRFSHSDVVGRLDIIDCSCGDWTED